MKSLSLGQSITLACLLEATAPKPGNVHRGADFEDLTFTDFAVSAAIVGPILENAARRGVGQTILDAVQATRNIVGTNTNLGMLLLLAPLAAVPRSVPLVDGISAVLQALSPEDCQHVYEAIRVACPGGLGEVDQMDVNAPPPSDLLAAMTLAAPRDMVARQYVEKFHHVLQWIVPWLAEGRASGLSLIQSIIHVQMRLMSQVPDSLIIRKRGISIAEQAAMYAQNVLDAGPPHGEEYSQALGDFDFWLRADGHSRNPGTTADLIAAGLFASIRDEIILPPFR